MAGSEVFAKWSSYFTLVVQDVTQTQEKADENHFTVQCLPLVQRTTSTAEEKLLTAPSLSS